MDLIDGPDWIDQTIQYNSIVCGQQRNSMHGVAVDTGMLNITDVAECHDNRNDSTHFNDCDSFIVVNIRNVQKESTHYEA